MDTAKGLHFLHSHRIMHLDLKSPNILVGADNTAKIADVGLAHVFTLHSLPAAKVCHPSMAKMPPDAHVVSLLSHFLVMLLTKHATLSL